MSTTVAVGGMQVTSTHEDAAAMTEALKPSSEESREPRVLVDKGQPVEDEEKDEISKAASELGKKGGEAAAKARAKAAREAKADAKRAEAEDVDVGAESGGGEAGAEGGKDEGEAPAPDTKKGNPRRDPQARVEQVVRAKAEAERRAEEAERRAYLAERRAEALERGRVETRDGAGEPRQPEATEDKPPSPEDFESYEEFVDARADWKFRQRLTEYQRQQMAHQAATAHVQRIDNTVSTFKGAVQKAIEADPEFMDRITDEVRNLVPTFTMPQGSRPGPLNWIADDFLSAPERAPALMLYLSEHPEDLQRIAALSSPRAITRELAKIEVGLDAATAGTRSRPEVSKAKPPVRPVTGSPHTADQELDDDAPLSAYVQHWNQRELKNSRR